jgi:hypothetical protein
MGFFQGITDGWKLFTSSFRVLFKHPVLLVPIFLSWILVAALILYLRYYFNYPSSFLLTILLTYLFIFLITFIISFSNIIMLELVQQMESGTKTSFAKALRDTFASNLLKVIPVAAVWALLWLIILMLKVARGKKRAGERVEPSVKDAALTLGGANGSFSWFKLGLSMLEKLLRMIVFLTLPGIAWENKGPVSAFKRAFEIVRKHTVQFLTAYTITGTATFFMVIPLLPIFYLHDAGVSFPNAVWTALILYEGLVWSLSIYLEQMSTGLLYLWHLKWLRKGGKGALSSVTKPDLLDEVYELK